MKLLVSDSRDKVLFDGGGSCRFKWSLFKPAEYATPEVPGYGSATRDFIAVKAEAVRLRHRLCRENFVGVPAAESCSTEEPFETEKGIWRDSERGLTFAEGID